MLKTKVQEGKQEKEKGRENRTGERMLNKKCTIVSTERGNAKKKMQ